MTKLYAALISLSLIWGLSFVFIEVMIDHAGVWGTVFLRCFAGVIILLPIVLYDWRKGKLQTSIPYKTLLIVGIFNAGLPWGFIALSQTIITSSSASVLNATTPIWTALIGFLFFSVFLTSYQWLGIIVGFIGIFILTDFQMITLLRENFVGVGTMLLAAASYGFASQYAKKHLSSTSVLVTTTGSLIVGALIGVGGMIVTEPFSLTALLTPTMLISIIGLGCLGSGIAHLLFYYLISKGSPEFATTVTYLIPGTAILWGAILLNEPISPHLLIGLVVIFFGVYLATNKRKR